VKRTASECMGDLTIPGRVLASAVSLPLSVAATWLLWGWFMVPLGLPAIGIAHAFGLDVLVSHLVRQNCSEGMFESATEVVAYWLATSLTAITFGFLAHLAMP
jgi:hypothetical protein